MDRRLHLCVDGRRLALCGCRRRSLLSPGRRLVDERSNDGAVRHRCPGDGDLATRQARCATASLRSWQPVHQRAVPEADDRPGRRLLDEPFRHPTAQLRLMHTWSCEACAYETPRSLISRTASSLNSRVNFRLSMIHLRFHQNT